MCVCESSATHRRRYLRSVGKKRNVRPWLWSAGNREPPNVDVLNENISRKYAFTTNLLYGSCDRNAADLDLTIVHPVVAVHLDARSWRFEDAVSNRVGHDVVKVVGGCILGSPCA